MMFLYEEQQIGKNAKNVTSKNELSIHYRKYT